MRAALLFSYLLVIGAGVSLALQQILNVNLRTQIGSPWWAGFVSYFVGMVAMLAVALTSTGPRPAVALVSRTSWMFWTGGIFGATFIAVAIFMIPRLGAATTLALIVVGQMLGSLAFDHFGLLGIPHHAASPTRLAGAGFLILGVVLIKR